MRRGRILLIAPIVVLLWTLQALAGPFAVFPKVRELESPGRQFIVFEDQRESEVSGAFHKLWLKVAATGESRKIQDYIGTAAVSWQDDDHLIITEYLNRRTSRAFLLSVSRPADSIMIDVPMLIRSIPPESRDTLRQNDHVFVEAVGATADRFHLHVWGYGQHDPRGFRWDCEYLLNGARVSCSEDQSSK